MKWIDIPPVWLLAFAAMVWLLRGVAATDSALLATFGTALVVAGIALMVLAVIEMQRRRTTPIPHRDPSALVASGPFAFSRNPIYLGDAAILGGLALRWDAPLGLLLVPVFMWVITVRFIRPEEARLRRAFGADFDAYASRVRRWL